MSEIIYIKGVIPDESDLLKLYSDAGWKAYVKDIDKLVEAFSNSLYVATAWNDNELAGLLRAVGDGSTILYIQDILVLRKCRRMGIGTKLIKDVLTEYDFIRQKVLITDNTPETKGFYNSLGFIPCQESDIIAYIHRGTKE